MRMETIYVVELIYNVESSIFAYLFILKLLDVRQALQLGKEFKKVVDFYNIVIWHSIVSHLINLVCYHFHAAICFRQPPFITQLSNTAHGPLFFVWHTLIWTPSGFYLYPRFTLNWLEYEMPGVYTCMQEVF